MVDEIVNYTNSKCDENFEKLKPNSIVSFDVSWDHVFGHCGWGFLRDCKTGLLLLNTLLTIEKMK